MTSESDAARAAYAEIKTATDLVGMREKYEQAGLKYGLNPKVSRKQVSVGKVSADLLTNEGSGPGVVLYLHGGGYAAGSARSHGHLAAEIAVLADADALVLDYRLMPDHVFPTQLEDALAAYQYLLGTHGSAAEIALVGDSAGGNLVMALLLAIKRQGLPKPSAAALISPLVDFRAEGESMRTKAEADPIITRQATAGSGLRYLADRSPDDPEVDILGADLSGLPPLLIQVGASETLLDDSVRLARKAGHDNVDVTLEIAPEMVHVYQFFFPVSETARASIERIGAFLARRLPSS
ncbi:alpha/beta hydrolase [Streptomyces sp. NPDC102360]|uniref:alpha/beta hydrolase n=1 Tax=Streptomyces sp. NPDC102360 TaxID=3366160 RepID=UPI00382DC80A